jgi:hypothetical protein
MSDEPCYDALLPDGPKCPRCGGPRAPSGVDGGSWVHFHRPAPAAAGPTLEEDVAAVKVALGATWPERDPFLIVTLRERLPRILAAAESTLRPTAPTPGLDLAELRRRHQRKGLADPGYYCDACYAGASGSLADGPCAVWLLLGRHDALRERVAALERVVRQAYADAIRRLADPR